MLKRFFIFIVPVALLAVAWLAVPRLGGLPPVWQEILPWLPYTVITVGMFLSLNFHRGRAFYVLLMLAVFNFFQSIGFYGFGNWVPALMAARGANFAQSLEYSFTIAISFPRDGADIDEARRLVKEAGGHAGIVAKVERAEAVDNLEDILAASDAVMVARGDLGVEVAPEKVPIIQKHVIRRAADWRKPVITATQMLESMIENPRPTRAEASDVANAILDGTDAVMLSAETAAGEYPVLAVEAMARIIQEIERAELEDGRRERRAGGTELALQPARPSVDDAIAFATTVAAERLAVPVIVCFTRSGFTARKISACRPRIPILAFSTEAVTCRQLALVWGVVSECATRAPNYDAMLEGARGTLLAKRYAAQGDHVVVTAGVPFEVPGTTNLLKVETV